MCHKNGSSLSAALHPNHEIANSNPVLVVKTFMIPTLIEYAMYSAQPAPDNLSSFGKAIMDCYHRRFSYLKLRPQGAGPLCVNLLSLF